MIWIPIKLRGYYSKLARPPHHSPIYIRAKSSIFSIRKKWGTAYDLQIVRKRGAVDPKTKDREVPFLSVIFPALVEDHTSVGFELGSRRACQCDSFQVISSRNKGGALFLSEKALLEVIGEVVFLDSCTSSDFSRSSCTHRTTTPRDTDA